MVHKIVSIGSPIPDDVFLNENIHGYSFNPDVRGDKIVNEADYWGEEMRKISYDHLAEFAAWWVLAEVNPLELADSDFVALVSSRKFTDLTGISLARLDAVMPQFCEDLDRSTAGMIRAYPDREFMYDQTSFFHPGHFDYQNCMKLAREHGLRDKFNNYCPLWRNYFVFRFDVLKRFVSWIEEHLMPVLFDKGVRPKWDVIESISPRMTSYNPYRVFGLFVEFFCQRFFYDEKIDICVIDKDLRRFVVRYVTEYLDWNVWNVTPVDLVRNGK